MGGQALHEVVCQIMTVIPSYEVTVPTWTVMHPTLQLTPPSSCQKLAFPYVWVSAKYGTDVPAPPQLSLLPGVSDRKTMP